MKKTTAGATNRGPGYLATCCSWLRRAPLGTDRHTILRGMVSVE